jgi:8-oxo-dGTP pyrophosphatase MutT (NUDIX family)
MPGRSLLVTARNPLLLDPADGSRGFSSAQLRAALEHRGFRIDVLAAPGAAARVAGRRAVFDPQLDRTPGLLDAAPRLVAVAQSPRSSTQRSERFFTTLPRKVVAAAVLCRDPAGRVLVVHDAFRRHWTIPGGVVDADEDPRTGAAREAWEEAGVRVQLGALLGVFSASWPDRLVLVYGAAPAEGAPSPRPVQAHEIDAAAWVPLDEALERVAGYVRWQIERCLEQPGGTWRQ